MPTNLENAAVATGLEKVSFHSITKERQCQRMFKLPHNCTHFTYFQMYKLDLEKAEKPEIKLSASTGSQKKQGNSRKNIYFCFIDYTKAFDCVYLNNLENSERDGNTRPPYLPPEKRVCRSRSNSQNQTWNNRTGSKLGQEYVKAVYCHPAYLTYIQSTS